MTKYVEVSKVNDEIVRVLEHTDCRDEHIDRVLRAIEKIPTIELIDDDTREFCKRLHPTWESGYAAGFNDGRRNAAEKG